MVEMVKCVCNNGRGRGVENKWKMCSPPEQLSSTRRADSNKEKKETNLSGPPDSHPGTFVVFKHQGQGQGERRRRRRGEGVG